MAFIIQESNKEFSPITPRTQTPAGENDTESRISAVSAERFTSPSREELSTRGTPLSETEAPPRLNPLSLREREVPSSPQSLSLKPPGLSIKMPGELSSPPQSRKPQPTQAERDFLQTIIDELPSSRGDFASFQERVLSELEERPFLSENVKDTIRHTLGEIEAQIDCIDFSDDRVRSIIRARIHGESPVDYDEPLGEGGDACVYTMRNVNAVAVKVFHSNANARSAAHDEIAGFKKLGRSNGLPTALYFAEGASPLLFMEKLEGEDGYDKYIEGASSSKELAKDLGGWLQGIRALHDQGIVHGDFKLDNVIDGRVIDCFNTDAEGVLHKGTAMYLPPEARLPAQATPAMDIWALGVTLYMAIKKDELPEGSGRKLQEAVHESIVDTFRANMRAQYPDADEATIQRRVNEDPYARFFSQFIPGCFAHDPAKRPSIETLIERYETYFSQTAMEDDV